MSKNDRAGEAIEQIHDQLNDQHLASIGVGDGSGNLFVKGPYEAVKQVQRFILENEQLRRDRQFNGLTAAEHERLALLMEELGEAQQVIGKILRHGFDSHHPDNPEVSNRDLLHRELGDVNAAVNLLCKAQDLDAGRILNCTNHKLARVGQYLHHN